MAEPAPLFAAIADGPEDGMAVWLTTSDGARIRAATWGTGAANGTVFLFPGRTEYIEKYGRAARDLAQRGFATLTVDWRGQGLATRFLPNPALGDVGRFGDYQKDVAALLAHARATALPQPYYLLCHSMGGCIGLRSLMDGFPAQAVAFTAPMWGIRMAPAMRPVAWAVTTFSRPLGFGHLLSPGQTLNTYVLTETFQNNTLTTDPAMWDYLRQQMQAQPDLALGGPTLRWISESLLEMRALARLPSPALPCVTWLGTDEQIIETAPIHARMGAWPGGTLNIADGARHEVLMDTPDLRRRVFDSIGTLFRNHTRSGVAPAA